MWAFHEGPGTSSIPVPLNERLFQEARAAVKPRWIVQTAGLLLATGLAGAVAVVQAQTETDKPDNQPPAQEKPKTGSQPGAPAKLDEGQLDTTWFEKGGQIAFHSTGTVDYLWVKEGASLSNRKFVLDKWEEPVLGPERDKHDREKASELTGEMPDFISTAMCQKLTTGSTCSLTDGDIRVVGRFVDINAGRAFAFVPATSTFDMKLLDAGTGELLVAIHHRVIGPSGINLRHWLSKLGTAFNKGLEDLYQKGGSAGQ